jgi:L-fuconolactonase
VIVDSHLHVWDLARAEYPWLTEDAGPLYRDHAFDEIAPTLRRLGIDGAVLVQASDEAADTALMLDTARRHPEVLGVVAWAPLDRPDLLPGVLAELQEDPLVVGVRVLVHEREPGWLEGAEQDRGLGLLAAAGLPLDFPTTGPAALAELPGIGARHPELSVVIDHLGKPPVGGDAHDRAEWRALLARAAENPRVSAKLSGLYSSVGALDSWTVDGLRPFVEDALDVFGPARLMYGGDWPVARLAGGYERTWDALQQLLAALTPEETALVLGGSAEQVYRIPSR